MLIDSLHPKKEFEPEEAWSNELKQRISRYEQGEGSTKPWDEIQINARALLD